MASVASSPVGNAQRMSRAPGRLMVNGGDRRRPWLTYGCAIWK